MSAVVMRPAANIAQAAGVETFGRPAARHEVVERHVEALAGRRVDDFGAPVGHAHRIVSEQHEDTPRIDDFVADSHENRRGHRSSRAIGAGAGGRGSLDLASLG